MGMYTELQIALRVPETSPAEVIEILKFMTDKNDYGPQGNRPTDPTTPDHPFFSTPRWRWCMYHSSYYFDRQPHVLFEYDKIAMAYNLTFGANIKNYDNEWEHFLDWIAPYAENDGYKGTYWYEEWDCPQLVFFFGGKSYLVEAKEVEDFLAKHGSEEE